MTPNRAHDERQAFPDLDTSDVPLGERALRRILEHVVAVGDASERHYLEIKSDVDPRTKIGAVKIAKFLLGAANRQPRAAREFFRGYAVMVLGVGGGTPGVERGVELHEIEDAVRPYLGSGFPPFEFGRLAVAVDREVLFVIASPPKEGQQPFVCHKDFQGDDRANNLRDGGIYFRGHSNTREAKSGEIEMLIERANVRGRPDIAVKVSLSGRAGRVSLITETLEHHYSQAERDALQRTLVPRFGIFNNPGVAGEARTEDERSQRIDSWRRRQGGSRERSRAYMLGVGLEGVEVHLESRDRFVDDPEIVLTFAGCEVLPWRDGRIQSLRNLIPDPLSWGEVPTAHGGRLGACATWRDVAGDAEVVLRPESLRPNRPWSSGSEEFVLLARDQDASSVDVAWVLTEAGSDQVVRGTASLATTEVVPAQRLVRQHFR